MTLFRASVRERLHALTAYLMSHGVSDAALAQRKAIVVLGDIVRQQAMIVACADTFAVLGALLLLTAGLLLLTRRGPAGGPSPIEVGVYERRFSCPVRLDAYLRYGRFADGDCNA